METENYIDHLERYAPISQGIRAYLRIIVKISHYHKHQRIDIGQITHGCYPLILRGAIRLYASGAENLSEHTLAFWFEQDFIPCFAHQQTPFAGNLQIDFLEETQVLSIPEKHSLSILKLFRESGQMVHAYQWEQQARLIDQLLIRNVLNAAEGYRTILSLQPEIAKKATVRDIASYLGVDERTLSRIRAVK
ncbi:Crp/Fnr family transcriptional regulator [Pedobacter frigidisoli]|uniref:Crp/Fnr family transcriptional regulator n=1 Tax=Pedobacter frigidisoli TaxID=2530455 RepID=A0A4R0P231_9SPHI|nr:Crp/Fnr family transcriptional regulator [Pedobacter frigidisoli]TCD07677.1 Crp/Fnr family transcriptional regulator [Pedobacter frigidisoli]